MRRPSSTSLVCPPPPPSPAEGKEFSLHSSFVSTSRPFLFLIPYFLGGMQHWVRWGEEGGRGEGNINPTPPAGKNGKREREREYTQEGGGRVSHPPFRISFLSFSAAGCTQASAYSLAPSLAPLPPIGVSPHDSSSSSPSFFRPLLLMACRGSSSSSSPSPSSPRRVPFLFCLRRTGKGEGERNRPGKDGGIRQVERHLLG